MVFAYSCPKCRRILGSDTDIISAECPGCGTAFDERQIRSNRGRDRWMHILALTGCAGVGGASTAMILAMRFAPDSPRLRAFVMADGGF